MGEDDGLAVRAADRRRHDVAEAEFRVRERMAVPEAVMDVFREPAGFRRHGVEAHEPVAAVDVEVGHDRAELVRGVELRVPVQILPCALVVVFHAVRYRAQIVLIAALAVQDFAEEAFLDHVEDGHLLAVVAAVFHQHAGDAGLLVGPDEIPALPDRLRRTDLESRVASGFHRRDGDLDMVVPVGRDESGFAAVVPREDVPVVDRSEHLVTVAFCAHRAGCLHAVLVLVADGGDLHVLHFEKLAEPPLAPSSDSDDAHSDRFHRNASSFQSRISVSSIISDRTAAVNGSGDEILTAGV